MSRAQTEVLDRVRAGEVDLAVTVVSATTDPIDDRDVLAVQPGHPAHL